jgi:hypothetical protein
MGFLKELGQGAGWLVGGVTGGLIKGVGEVTGSKFIQEVGDGVKHSTEFVGKQLGNVAEGVWNVGSGLVTKDDHKIDQGFDDVGEGVVSTAKAVGQGISTTVQNVGNVAGGLMEGDNQRWKQGLREVGKTVAVGALGISVLDLADVVDINGNEGGIEGNDSNESNESSSVAMEQQPDVSQVQTVESDANSTTTTEYITQENPNEHFVEPHWRTLESGEKIWVDGDGNTNIDRTVEQGGGWNQDNPDYRNPAEQA